MAVDEQREKDRARFQELAEEERIRLAPIANAKNERLVEMLVQSWAQWKSTDELLEREGSTYIVRNKDGEVQKILPYPQVAIASGACAQYQRLISHPLIKLRLSKLAKESECPG